MFNKIFTKLNEKKLQSLKFPSQHLDSDVCKKYASVTSGKEDLGSLDYDENKTQFNMFTNVDYHQFVGIQFITLFIIKSL